MMDLLGHRRAVLCGQRFWPMRAGRSVRVLAELPIRLERKNAMPEIRWDKVVRIRRALRAGLYDVDARLEELLSN